MRPGALIGLVIAVACIIGGNIWEGGHVGAMVGGPAFVIVIGGTIGAIVVQYPFGDIKTALSMSAALFKPPKLDGPKLVEEICDYANRARRDGILALEKVSENASDPFLKKALMMAVDGVDSQTLRETLEVTIGVEEHHAENGAKVLEAGGGYAPTVGIIGAVLGLIHVMSNLSDIAAVGVGIAGAFVATIYGVAFANLLCLPLASRIKLDIAETAKLREMELTGVLAIQAGLNPKLVRDRLVQFLGDHGHHEEKKK
jgi:chemotaxis protein MotA